MAESAPLRGRLEIGERRLSLRAGSKSPLRHVDPVLLVVSVALSVLGALAIYSATRGQLTSLNYDPHLYLKKQLMFLALASGAMVITLLFDYRQIRHLAPLVYGAGVLLLVVVLSPAGHTSAGAQRWIDVGPLQLQPSEILKVVLIVSLAALYSEERGPADLKRLAAALAVTGLPAALVYLQPDLGTVMVLGAVFLSVLVVTATRLRWIAGLLLGGVAAFILVVQLGLLHDYQVARLTAFLDDRSDSQRAGYNLEQSKIAIGSGGATGKGIFHGTQTNLAYVPHQHTDFIFTVVGEETGFVGSAALIGLFGIFLWRALRIAVLSRDRFGTCLAAGVAGMVVFQMFVNIGMTLGIMPITGIPLPFVSYGGSSLITSFVSAGLLMNVHMRRFT